MALWSTIDVINIIIAYVVRIMLKLCVMIVQQHLLQTFFCVKY
jgi:hypothetical protein